MLKVTNSTNPNMAQEIDTDLVQSGEGTSLLPRMTFEEFLTWSDEHTFAEWVDGEVILMSPVSTRHQDLASFLAAALRLFVEANDRGRILTAPFLMKLSTRPSGREPDVQFIGIGRLANLTNNYLEGPADLVIEIVSPESRTRDRKDKYFEYEKAGVPEYWLIDPLRQTANFYSLNREGRYESIELDEGVFRSPVLTGLWLKVDWLWQETLPTLMFVLKEWGLV